MKLETERPIIREIHPDDAAALEYTKQDKYSYHKSQRPHADDRLEIEIARNITSMSETPQRFWSLVLVLKSTDQVIGGIKIFIPDIYHSVGEIGFDLNGDYWRSGYTTEAVKAVLDYCHEELKMHRVIIRADARNIASWRVAERIGMHYEGAARYDYMTWQGFVPEMKIYASVRPELIPKENPEN